MTDGENVPINQKSKLLVNESGIIISSIRRLLRLLNIFNSRLDSSVMMHVI